jgi:hypothetical protein
MSAYRSDHIVYGWKLPFDIKDGNGKSIDLWNDKFLPVIEGHEGEEFTLISDYMCGEYAVFGLGVKSCRDNEKGWGFEDLCFQDFDENKVIQKFRELFEIEPVEKPRLFIFSNYS